MCGIFGYTGTEPALDRLLNGMENLAYRGYDSNGVVIQNGNSFSWKKLPGSLEHLLDAVNGASMDGTSGIGHTRWATHGPPNQDNAHPHFSCNDDVAVVHNGIIENHDELRTELKENGHLFRSETDTEVLPHLIEEHRGEHDEPVDVLRHVLPKLKGSYAIAVLFLDRSGSLYGACNESPLLAGVGPDEFYLSSDIPALLQFTREVKYLEDGEVAEVSREGVRIVDRNGNKVSRATDHIDWDVESAEKQGYEHFMLKEIHEQPEALRDTMAGRVNGENGSLPFDFDHLTAERVREFDRVQILACGTSYHAGLVGKYYIQDLVDLPVDVALGSEFRYAPAPMDENVLTIAISQSGETADTLAAVDRARDEGVFLLSVCNVMGSSLARESDEVFYSRAGPEIGVAATKTYTTQILSMLLITMKLARMRNTGQPESDRLASLISEVAQLPKQISTILDSNGHIPNIAKRFQDVYNYMFIGRYLNYPTALEGALKLKEISYIHAEGYAGGEMKHGPLALVEDTVPTVAIAPDDRVYSKMRSNIQEIYARDGVLIGLVTEGDTAVAELCDHKIELPPSHELLSPILYTVPLQLLSYHMGDLLGRDIDQPRNLAKSVTVE